MPPAKFLRRLDQRVLPPIGRALSGFSRGGRRLRLVMVIASILSLAVVVLTVYVATRSPATGAQSQGPRVRVGVTAGTSISAYAQQSADRLRQRLASEPGKSTVALVSLSPYVTPDQLRRLVGPTVVLLVYTHVVVTGQQTEVRTFRTYSHLDSDMHEAAGALAEKATDQDALRKLVTGDSDDDRALRAQYTRQAAVYHAEAKAYGLGQCRCVFALVVYATPGVLTSLAAADGVRAVDPVASSVALINIDFAPPLP
jgi:hypothetical protein